MIYLDNNATTPLDPRVAAAMRPWIDSLFGNASSVHAAGRRARSAVDAARDKVADLLAAPRSSVVFTSGATESNNAAIVGAVAAGSRRAVVTSAVEHPSVSAVCDRLAARGHPLTRLPVDTDGRLDPARVADAVSDDTALVSIQLANSETGVLQPIAEIASVVHARGALLHVDAVQAVGKIPVSFDELGADLLSVSAHKFHGPQGVGALLVRPGIAWEPLIVGGPQERNRRGGTENVAGIVGFGEACSAALEFLRADGSAALAATRDNLTARLRQAIPRTVVTGETAPRVPQTLNLRIAGITGEALLMAIGETGICVSTGSACSSGSVRAGPVLPAMGLDDAEARSAVRLSVSRFTTDDEIARAAGILAAAVARLRELSDDDPLAL